MLVHLEQILGSVLDNRRKGTGFRVYTVCLHQKTMNVSSTKCTSNKRARNIQNMPKTWVHITPTVCQGPLHFIPQWNINYFCTKTTSSHSHPVWLCLRHSRKQKLRQQDEWSRKSGCAERSLPLNHTFACPHCSSPFSAIQLNGGLTSPRTVSHYWPLNFLIPWLNSPFSYSCGTPALLPTSPDSVSDSAALESIPSKIRITSDQSTFLLS